MKRREHLEQSRRGVRGDTRDAERLQVEVGERRHVRAVSPELCAVAVIVLLERDASGASHANVDVGELRPKARRGRVGELEGWVVEIEMTSLLADVVSSPQRHGVLEAAESADRGVPGGGRIARLGDAGER